MIFIQCPYCNEERTEDELTYGGEVTIIRPTSPDKATDTEWTEYLYFRTNLRGAQLEQWCCSGGCGRWFKVERDTVSHKVTAVVRYDGQLPKNVDGERIPVSQEVMDQSSHNRGQSEDVTQ